MKWIYVLSVVILASVYAKETYTSENDDLDIEAVIKDPNNLKAFVGCFLDTVKCDSVSGDFKKDIPEAVQQLCAKCTDAQKHIFKRFIEGLKKNIPADYEAFKNKYDPEGKHFDSLVAAVANY